MQKLKNKNIRKLLKLGETSLAVTLPVEIVEELKWKKKQKVVVKKDKKRIIISDWKKE